MTGPMRTLLTTFTLGALLLPAHAIAQVYPERIRSHIRAVEVSTRVYQGNAQRETQTERVTKSVRLPADGEIALSNLAGDIVVTRGSGNEVTIEAIKTARGRTVEEAKQVLQTIQLEIVERGERLEISARYPHTEENRRRGSRSSSGSIAFNITAPERARISANSLSGNMSVRDIKGELSLETISGNVSITNAGRVSQAKTMSGDVEILDTTIEGVMDAATVSGTMRVRNVKAERLDVGSVSGDVVLENVRSKRIDAQSVSGSVQLSGSLVPGGRYDLGSHSGEILITISGDVGFELDASSFSGNIRSDIDIKTESAEPASRGRRRRSLSGTHGDGSAFLDVTTFSGSIVITR
jgi:DUF4097 and DUF4098 domain-containing protein YvlB